ncbi:MAG: apolipoprotein N-acyltransferase [Alphaproteobacteria bacterium]|nr:apolipoprotein N-acyltransferase [Alphaproteobacteria bacterium]
MFTSLKERLRGQIRFLLLLCAGGVAGLIFPPFNGAVLGYVAIILFLAYLYSFEKVDKKVFWRAYIFSFSFFIVAFSWICNALLIDGDKFINFIPVVILAIGGFFGLFLAIPAYLIKWGKNCYAKALIFCVGVVFFEWIRSFIFTGFPWNLFGSALSFNNGLLQGASIIGTYGLSFVFLLLLSGISILVLGIVRCKFYGKAIYFILFPVLFLVGASLLYEKQEIGDIKVRLVQPSIPQTFKWDEKSIYHNFREYIDLSKSQNLDGVDIVVWGETATPYFLDRDERHLKEVTEAIAEDGFLITGLMRASFDGGEYQVYNSMFVIDDNGVIKDYYDKSHLVPFGEFLPFRKYLPDFMKPIAKVVGNIKRGEKYKNIRVKNLPLMGGAICYESIFPKEVLNKNEKPEILMVLANDGWYGVSAGPYQHLVASQLRAIEEGITVVRSANTGISAVIYPNGEIVGNIGLNEKGISDVNLPKILEYDTIYGMYGNSIVFLIMLLAILIVFWVNKKSSKS